MFIAQVRSSTSAAWSRYEAQCGAVTETEARCGAIPSARPRFVAKAEFMDSITAAINQNLPQHEIHRLIDDWAARHEHALATYARRLP